MALLTSYSAANRVVQSDTSPSYSRQFAYGSWSYSSGTSVITLSRVWEYHRYRAKSYRYVGMTKSAAAACAEAMVAKYTRSTQTSIFNSSGVSVGEFTDIASGTILMADISVEQVDGNMYDCVINVNEDDIRLRVAAVTPSSLFTAENARDYDD